MPRTVPVLAAATLAVLFAASPARALECSLEGVVLECGKTSQEILEAFASPQTGAMLERPLDVLERFERPADIERFRKSLETAWRAVNRAERAERRKLQRRQISAAEFETWSQTYDRALRHYAAGVTFYRTLVWHGKTGKAAPQDG